MTIARDLAERICAFDHASHPADAVYWSKIAVLDTVGVTLAGCYDDPPSLLARVLDSQVAAGPSLIFGGDRRIGCLEAARINGTASHAIDFDNISPGLAGHISAVMVPALIAAAEAYDVSGKDLLLAHTIGYEVGSRLGQVVHTYHTDRGWHPTMTVGVFSVAAACAKLLNATAEQTATALSLSASFAAGLKANFGTMAKPLHSGQCAHAGLFAVLLAKEGYTANEAAIEHKQGYLNVFNGPGNYNTDGLFQNWGDPLLIVQPGARYKQYACCASTHSPIEAAVGLARKDGPFNESDIAKVDIWVHESRLPHCNRPFPKTDLDAKFSIQYCAVRGILNGAVKLYDFENSAFSQKPIQDLLKKVTTTPTTLEQFPDNNRFGCEIRLEMKNGKVLNSRVERVLGKSVDYAIPEADMKLKFRDCALRALTPDAVAQAEKLIDNFENVASVKDFTKVIEVRKPKAKAA